MRLDLEAIRERWSDNCRACGGTGELTTSHRFTCYDCNGSGKQMPPDVAAMLAELERLYAVPVAEPAQEPTPGEREAVIAGELRRMVTKPRSGGEQSLARAVLNRSCPRCGSLAVFDELFGNDSTSYYCRSCGGKW